MYVIKCWIKRLEVYLVLLLPCVVVACYPSVCSCWLFLLDLALELLEL